MSNPKRKAKGNLNKLADRLNRCKIKGSGDKR